MAEPDPGEADAKGEGSADGRSSLMGRSPQSRRRPFRVLLGITGSVAAVKGPELICQLMDALSPSESGGDGGDDDGFCDDDAAGSVEVRVVLTRGGSNFWSCAREYDPASWRRLQERLDASDSNDATRTRTGCPGPVLVYESDHEWRDWRRMGDPVLHIELRNWADVMVVAPLSAHTLAKLANGLCDDTLSCVARAWWTSSPARPSIENTSGSTNKPMVVAPAMNTGMWQHPVTERQLEALQSFAPEPGLVTVVRPQVKTLACGETGDGALAPIQDIVEAVARVRRQLVGRFQQTA